MKIRVCVAVDVAAFATMEIEAAQYSPAFVKRMVIRAIEAETLEFKPEDPGSDDYRSGLRIVTVEGEGQVHLDDDIPVDPDYYGMGQDAVYLLRQYCNGDMSAADMPDQLAALAERYAAMPGDMHKNRIERGLAQIQPDSSDWAF